MSIGTIVLFLSPATPVANGLNLDLNLNFMVGLQMLISPDDSCDIVFILSKSAVTAVHEVQGHSTVFCMSRRGQFRGEYHG